MAMLCENRVLAMGEAPAEASCAASRNRFCMTPDGCESDTSTSVDSDSEGCPEESRKHWADFEDSDDDDMVANASSQQADAVIQKLLAARGEPRKDRKVIWADLVDSESEDEHVVAAAVPQVRRSDCVSSVHGASSSTSADNVEANKSSAAATVSNSSVDVQVPSKKVWATAEVSQKHAIAHSAFPGTYSNVGKGNSKGKGKGAAKGTGKGYGKSAGKGLSKGSDGKAQCQFVIGIEEDSKFHVVKRIIGAGGANMKNIAEETGAKLRLRGRGSKFLEGPARKESSDDLMLCISSHSTVCHVDAKKMVSELLEHIYEDYRVFCSNAGKVEPSLHIQLHEGYREGSR